MLLNLREDHDFDPPSERISDRGAAGCVLRRFFTERLGMADCPLLLVRSSLGGNKESRQLHTPFV